jgi:hypothetical protein
MKMRKLVFFIVLILASATFADNYLGTYAIDANVDIPLGTRSLVTGADANADSLPVVTVYDANGTDANLYYGTFAFYDPTHTIGQYSKLVAATDVNGFKAGHKYKALCSYVMGGVTVSTTKVFQIDPNNQTLATAIAALPQNKTGYTLTDPCEAKLLAAIAAGPADQNDPNSATIIALLNQLDPNNTDPNSLAGKINFIRWCWSIAVQH